MPALLEEIENQRKAVKDFETALELCKNPLPVPAVSFEPFQNLQNILTAERDEEARMRRLAQAEASLELAKDKLAELEQLWANQQREAEKQWAKFSKMLKTFNNLSEQQTAIATQLLEQWPDCRASLEKVWPAGTMAYLAPDLLRLIHHFEINEQNKTFHVKQGDCGQIPPRIFG